MTKDIEINQLQVRLDIMTKKYHEERTRAEEYLRKIEEANYVATGGKLFKADEFREAEAEYRRLKPSAGDYWYEDHYCPVLVVLSVASNFITVCCKKKDVGNNKWTWDLTQPELLARDAFMHKLRDCRVGGSHYWAAEEYARGANGRTAHSVEQGA